MKTKREKGSAVLMGLSVALTVFTGCVGANRATVSLTENDLKLTGECARAARAAQPSPLLTPDPRRKDSGSHKNIVKAYAAAPENPIVLFGDSLTDNWRGRKRFDAMKEEFNVVNAGICADRIGDVLWRIQDMAPALAAKPPRVATFMIGVNDLGKGLTPEEMAAGLRNLIAVFRGICPTTKIIIFAIPPHAVCHDNRVIPFVDPVNRRYRELADDKDVFYFDFGRLLVDRHGFNVLPELYESDRLHFSDKGYAEVLTPFIGGAIRLVLAKNFTGDYTRRLGLWLDYLELRRKIAERNNALEELWKNEHFLREFPHTLLKEFAALKADPDHVPQLPPEYLRQGREEGLPPALR